MKELKKLLYKTSLCESEGYILRFDKRGRPNELSAPEQIYHAAVPMSNEKQENLIDLFISESLGDFDKNLVSDNDFIHYIQIFYLMKRIKQIVKYILILVVMIILF